MNHLLTVFSLLLLLSSCDFNTSCLSKEAFIKSYDRLLVDIESHHKDLKSEDWVSIDEEFTSFTKQCYTKFKTDMSVEERVSFWKNTLKYQAYRSEDIDFDNLLSEDMKLQLKEDMKELSVQGQKEIENFIQNELAPELENVIDEVVDGIKEIGDQLKELLKEATKSDE